MFLQSTRKEEEEQLGRQQTASRKAVSVCHSHNQAQNPSKCNPVCVTVCYTP